MVIHSIKTTLHPQSGDSYKKSEPSRGDFSAALTAARGDFTKTPSRDTYIVHAGDSLYRIAQRLKTTLALPQSVTTLVREMTSLNHLSDSDRIFPGQALRLPVTLQTKPLQNLASSIPHREGSPAATLIVSVTPPPTNTIATPPITTVPNQDFSLLAQQGNISLPAKIPDSYFLLKDFPMAESAFEEGTAVKTVSAANVPGELPATTTRKIYASRERDLETQIAMYKEDQLLAHPGGDYYFLNRTTDIHDPAFDQSTFINRLGKDLTDTGENLLNIAKNLALGAEFKYVTENGDIKAGQRVGLLGTLKNFVEDVFSGLSFGAYIPDGEREPEGAGASFGHFFKKIFYDAPIKDLLIGIPHAAVNIVKDTALASLNLLEVIPDATIGNFEWGQKATTTVFDNGQVVIDYLTDVLPGGDAWLRVHAAGPRGDIGSPVYFNLMTSEQGITDSRWASVRNTHFRKTIETVGSLLSDAAVVAIATHTYSPSSDQRHD